MSLKKQNEVMSLLSDNDSNHHFLTVLLDLHYKYRIIVPLEQEFCKKTHR